jgi:transposase InsO family protein
MSSRRDNIFTGTGTLPVVTAARDGEAPARGIKPPTTRAGARFDVPESRAWLNAEEAAALALPGFTFSQQHIRRFLSEGNIATRIRNGGIGRKGREFHWSSLPDAARAEYLKRFGVQIIENDRAEAAKSRPAQVALQAEARHLIVKAAQSFIADFRLSVGEGLKQFCAAYARKRTKLEAWVYEIIPQLHPGAIRTWDRIIRTKGAGALADGRERSGRNGLFDTDARLRAFVISQYAARPQLTAAHLVDAVRVDLNQEVALRTMQAFLKTLRDNNAPMIKALTNPDQYRSHHKVAFGSLSASVVRLNQRWEIDATRADAMCRMPDGTARRCALVALIDVYSRRAMVLVCDQGRAVATMALLRRAILAWGLPEVLKADNGKDFVAKSVQRFCSDLGIDVQLSRVFSPEQKGHIERFFGTMNRELFKMLPGFVGHNVAERSAIRSRESFAHRFGEEAQLVIETALSPSQLQARIDAWLGDIYEQRIHEGHGQTPISVALAQADKVRAAASERVLDALLMDAPGASGIRVVGKKGIKHDGRNYIAPELGAHAGYRVHVRIDPTDDGRMVVYNHDRTQFICVAEDAQQIDNNRLQAIARAAQSHQRAALRLVKSDVAKVQQSYPAVGLADRILGDASGDSFILQDDARKAMETAARPVLIAAQKAQDALDQVKAQPQPIEPTPDQEDAARAYIADMTARLPEQAATLQCDGYERPNFGLDDVATWLWLQGFIAQGGKPDATDTALLAELDASPAFHLLLAGRTGS